MKDYVGRGGLADIRTRLEAVEDAIESPAPPFDVSATSDGIKLVGNELRLDIDSLTQA